MNAAHGRHPSDGEQQVIGAALYRQWNTHTLHIEHGYQNHCPCPRALVLFCERVRSRVCVDLLEKWITRSTAEVRLVLTGVLSVSRLLTHTRCVRVWCGAGALMHIKHTHTQLTPDASNGFRMLRNAQRYQCPLAHGAILVL